MNPKEKREEKGWETLDKPGGSSQGSEEERSESKRYRHAKTVLKRLRQDFRTKHKCNLNVMEKSPHLAVHDLGALMKKLK